MCQCSGSGVIVLESAAGMYKLAKCKCGVTDMTDDEKREFKEKLNQFKEANY